LREAIQSGVKRLGSHLVRHTFAQTMGHTSDKRARHYAGEARKAAAAKLTAKYSLAG
jgi:hypothetical protein